MKEKKIRLFNKTTKIFLLTGLILAFFSAIALYFYTKYLLENEVEEVLFSTEARVVDALKKDRTLFSLPPVTEIKKIENLRPIVLKDTIIYDPSQDEMEVFRELSTYRTINGENYQIITRNLVVESKEILLAIVISNIIIFLLAFLFLFYYNTTKNLQLWYPFFKNLEEMKKFSLSSMEPLNLLDSDVLEFSELKKEITSLTNKVRQDYNHLKQFTENVSHELQTPLAIIQAKIDNIINEHDINEKQFEQVSSIQKDIQRLKQLNNRITILTKIDNDQFVKIENVNISSLIDEKIKNFRELEIDNIFHISEKQLVVSIDPFLADILINNLISNAIKYSPKHLKITATSKENSLKISNYGTKALLHPEMLFLRLYRENEMIQSSGLGLAIVKKICDYYNFDVAYDFKNQQHIFKINFGKHL
ncbi:MAG: two-component sensor histidine kinase [Flavobacteriaceae bacterium]|nr:two-component sensor histidine kinase [Flavobacteriaceae bacterium]